MVYFQTDYLQVELHDASNVLITQWYGRCNSLQYRQGLIQIVRIARDRQVRLAVVDRRLLQPVSEDDLDWSYHVYAKAYSKLPLQRLAVVSAFNSEAENQQKRIYNKDMVRFETRKFDDLTSAYDWLVSTT